MVVICAQDNEFALASGRNVDATSSYSYFDHPPNAFKDLVITSHPDDAAPCLFEEGETCSLSYGGRGGGGAIENATVIRSDLLSGPGQGVIVFEGEEPDLGLVQVVWTPNFDIHGWYRDNYSPRTPPAFYNYDTQSSRYRYVCFVAGTRLRTPTGMRTVESLRPGDLVLTRDDGAQPVRWIGRRTLPGVGASAPVVFAPGVLGNMAPLAVSQQHRMLITGHWAELFFGEAEVLVPAKALVNGGTIRVAPRARVTFLHLLLDRHEILDAEGAATESLYPGDIARFAIGPAELTTLADVLGTDAATGSPGEGQWRPARPFLSVREGSLLAAGTFPAPGRTALRDAATARIPA